MRRIIAAVAIVAALTLTMAPAAQAAPTYGRRFTAAHGYIVWTEGDARWSRVHCTWYAGNRSWRLSWLLAPHQYKWTTSDAGGWGDYSPRQLDCTYRRA
jgi:hypothetical protein